MSDNIDFSGIFDEGAEGQEVTEPAEEETEGEEEQEVAEPAEDDDPEQSDEDNARYAAARRKAERERDEAITRAREEAEASINDKLKAVGFINPYTNRPVESLEDLQAYTEQRAEESAQEAENRLYDAGLTEEEVRTLIAAHPDVRKAAADSERLAELERRAQDEHLQNVIDDEIAKISEFDPRIKDVKSLMESPYNDKVGEMVKHGYTISDAYKLAAFDELQRLGTTAAEQETRNKMSGKEHLNPTSSHGSGAVEVPADLMASFREIMPKASKEDIQKFYARDIKRMKK